MPERKITLAATREGVYITASGLFAARQGRVPKVLLTHHNGLDAFPRFSSIACFFQLEAKKNTLENVLNNNLKRKREELKQVRCIVFSSGY